MKVTDVMYGGFGALLPELLRLYRIRLDPFRPPPSYYVISLLFLLAAGVIVGALPGEKSALNAIYLGVASPFIISGLVRAATETAKAHGLHGHGDGESDEVDDIEIRESDQTRMDNVLRYIRSL
jgi:hypothetical protein